MPEVTRDPRAYLREVRQCRRCHSERSEESVPSTRLGCHLDIIGRTTEP